MAEKPFRMKISFEGEKTRVAYALEEKTAQTAGNSAHVMVPKAWIGKRVVAVLLDPLEEK